MGLKGKLLEEAIDFAVKSTTKKAERKSVAAAAKKAAAREGAHVVDEVVQPAARVRVDHRIEPRKKEAANVANMRVAVRKRQTQRPEGLSVFELEGKPFITSMSDRSAAGDDIVGINDVSFREPVSRLGGQDYMFDTPNSVWAADLGSAGTHLDLARRLRAETGQDPLFLPWAMGPTAIDFAHMPREAMLRYASEVLNKNGARSLTSDIRAILPDFKALDDPASFELFREAGGKNRAALNRLLDLRREETGLGMGGARLATTDLDQMDAPLTSLRNVGKVSSSSSLSPSTHPSYRTSIPGEGIGRLKEPVGALQLLPDLMERAGLDDPFGFPAGVVPGVASPLRALQMGPKGGVITDRILRAVEEYLQSRGTPP